MAAADLDGLVNDIFADLSLADLHMKPYKSDDRDAEAEKIARLRQLRLARCAEPAPKKPARRIIVVR